MADYRINQAWADTNLTGIGWNGGNIAEWAWAVGGIQVGDTVNDANGDPWSYVGSFFVEDGPSWSLEPANVNGVEASEIVFGALTDEEYGVSTSDTLVNRLAWYDEFQEGVTFYDDSLVVSGNYNTAGAQSAYVSDSSFENTNYVFKRAVSLSINTLQANSLDVVDVKYYNGTDLVDVELQVNGTIVWKV
jgi:hypothetical protein